MKKRYITLLASVLIIGALVAFGLTEYYRSHESAAEEDATVKMTAQELQAVFVEGDEAQHAKYKDAVIAVTGNVTEIVDGEKITITLDGAVRCELGVRPQTDPKEGDQVTVKGFFGGFDDMFGEVLMIRCHL